jgi:hypothetical protein
MFLRHKGGGLLWDPQQFLSGRNRWTEGYGADERGEKKKKAGGQVINKRVRMSDPHKIGVQLFLLMVSRGNHVCTSTVSLAFSCI